MYFNCDDPEMIAYVPVYCCENEIPAAFAAENNKNGVFNEKGAFWLCNFVANMVYPRYSAMIGDLRSARQELEDFFASEQDEVVSKVSAMTPGERVSYLNGKTAEYTDMMMKRWDRLWRELAVKYNDQPGGYDQSFYDAIVKATGDRYKVPE